MSLSAQQFAPLPGYPQYFGTKKVIIGELAGPTAYVQGGQVINASQMGWGFFDAAAAAMDLSYSGTYFCRVNIQPTSNNPSNQTSSVSQIRVMWIVVATGLEAAGNTNLSGEIIRLEVQGE